MEEKIVDENILTVIHSEFETNYFLDLIDSVTRWGIERNITAEGGATALSQTKKMAEELQEFIDAKTYDDSVDALGDMFVVLIQMHRLRGVMLEESLEAAWEQIRHRKGHMSEGIFIKEE